MIFIAKKPIVPISPPESPEVVVVVETIEVMVRKGNSPEDEEEIAIVSGVEARCFTVA
tara:strand:- start:95 stop:268 length:174 start_codon:yes stop_codon:yes gene_type:complete